MQTQSGEDGYVHLVLTSSPVVLVAVDPVNRFYAWRTFRYEMPMPRMEIPVRFLLWRPTAEQPWYDDSEWRVVGAEYEQLQTGE